MTEYVEQREDNYFLRGSRVSLDSIVYGFLDGDSPDAIRDNFPMLTLEQICGAISYYLEHKACVNIYLKGKKQAFEAARGSQTHIPSDLRARIEQARENLGPGV